jgi:hypothetical protein
MTLAIARRGRYIAQTRRKIGIGASAGDGHCHRDGREPRKSGTIAREQRGKPRAHG